MIAAANGKARRITVIMPFLYESRQHRRTARESMDCALALQELSGMGGDNIITFDAHDPRVQNAIPLHGFDTVQPAYQFVTQMQSNYVRKMVFNANHVTDTLFCQDNLKFSKKLRKAPVLPNRNDDIILIYDSTVFGSAKEGAVFYPELVVSKDILEREIA